MNRSAFFACTTCFAFALAACGGSSTDASSATTASTSTTTTAAGGSGGAGGGAGGTSAGGSGGAGGANAGGSGGAGGAAVQYPGDIDPALATSFRAAVEAFATASQKQAASCDFEGFTVNGTFFQAKGLAYTVTVTPVDLGGPEADVRRDYTVMFDSKASVPDPDDGSAIDPARSMIVGYISYVDPVLEKSGDTTTYQFKGVLIDQLEDTPLVGGPVPSQLVFTKLSPSNPPSEMLRIACPGP